MPNNCLSLLCLLGTQSLRFVFPFLVHNNMREVNSIVDYRAEIVDTMKLWNQVGFIKIYWYLMFCF